jgi:hypothetical protein
MSASALAITEALAKSTVAQSPSGRERSSSNATLHGGTSAKLIVPGEDPAAFEALLNGLLDDYRPDTLQSRLFVEQAAIAHWFLWRRDRAYSAIETAVYESEPDESKWTTEHFKKLALADRYKTQAERALKRALNNIEAWQKTSQHAANRERRNAQWQAEHAIRERRVTLQEQKFRFAKNALSSPQAQPDTTDEPERSCPVGHPVPSFDTAPLHEGHFGSPSPRNRY